MTGTAPQPALAEPSKEAPVHRLEVSHIDGDSYAVDVRGHRIIVDQPVDAGGADSAPTPTELFAASLGACVAFYAGRYLKRHGLPREGLSAHTEFVMSTDRPARVASLRVVVVPPPELPESRREGLLALASACAIHNTLHQPPEVTVELAP